jgi:hypothetical protein
LPQMCVIVVSHKIVSLYEKNRKVCGKCASALLPRLVACYGGDWFAENVIFHLTLWTEGKPLCVGVCGSCFTVVLYCSTDGKEKDLASRMVKFLHLLFPLWALAKPLSMFADHASQCSVVAVCSPSTFACWT